MLTSHSEPQGSRRTKIGIQLLPFIHPDVIPCVLEYDSTLQLQFLCTYGSGSGKEGQADGEMCRPRGLVLHKEELFVMDSGNHRIQVFHQGTGRFLRKWGQAGFLQGELRCPAFAAISLNSDGGSAELVVLDIIRNDVQFFRVSDSRYLRGFDIQESSGRDAIYHRGMAVIDDEVLISGCLPSQVDVFTKSELKHLRILKNDQKKLDLPSQVFVDPEKKEVFIADWGNSRIQVLDFLSGQALKEYEGSTEDGGKLLNPRGVVVHGEQVIVCDCLWGIVIFDRTSCRISLKMQINPFSADSHGPRPLAINSVGQLFVPDTDNHRIVVFE